MGNERPIGTNTAPIRYPTEGTNSYGRESQITKYEAPTLIDEVSDNLIYLGWADAGTLESDPKWKIRRIRRIGTVWDLKYANGNEFYRNVWNDRLTLTYL